MDKTAKPAGRMPGQRHDKPRQKPGGKPWHNKHHAGGRPGAKPRHRPGTAPEGPILLYGLHTVRHALENPRRVRHVLHVTRNALARLDLPAELAAATDIRETSPRDLDSLVGRDAVHQGAVLEAEPLEPRPMAEIGQSPLLLVLDQVTDPHNVGAIMRSAVALGAGALITTARHSPHETGVLAKSASGALDMIDHVTVRNLSKAIEELAELGYQTVGLDSEGPGVLENSLHGLKIALVMGAEGKGLRQKTRETCTTLARLDMPGAIKSLNVSNAAALALYLSRRHVDGLDPAGR
ncbi:MAG: RNA methyltransferase [Pseudomonadota bacterium]|nr:RNA methyltransferase [Pseudomonadota bacterium]